MLEDPVSLLVSLGEVGSADTEGVLLAVSDEVCVLEDVSVAVSELVLVAVGSEVVDGV
jgi:hypothetical protein